MPVWLLSLLATALASGEPGDRKPLWVSEHGNLRNLAFSCNGDMVATVGDGGARLWDAKTGKRLLEFGDSYWHMILSQDGRVLYTKRVGEVRSADGGKEKRCLVRAWDVESGKMLLEFECGKDWIGLGMGMWPHGAVFAVTDDPKYASFWNLEKQKRVSRREHPTKIEQVAFAPLSETVAALGRDKLVVWHPDGKDTVIKTGATMSEITNGRPFALSRDGKQIAALCRLEKPLTRESFHVSIWDARNGNELQRIPLHARFMDFSPDGKLLALPVFGKVHIWDLAARKEIDSWQAHPQACRAWFSPCGEHLATAGGGTIKLWKLNSGDKDP